jgi:hypothetical protein
MRHLIAVFALMIAGSAALAQNSAAPAAAGPESQMSMKNCPMQAGEAAKHKCGPEEGMQCRHGDDGPQCAKMDCGSKKCPLPGMSGPGGHCGKIMRCCHALAGCVILFVLLLNVLLTLLVKKDMGKRNAYNGLWIPVILLGGLPATLIYGVWRMKE